MLSKINLMPGIFFTITAGSALGDNGSNAVLCKNCSVLLCVLEQPRLDISNVMPLSSGTCITVMSLWHFNYFCSDIQRQVLFIMIEL